MDKQPKEDIILGMKGDSVEFQVEFTDEIPDTSPSFFLNEELQPTIGFTDNFSVTSSGDNVKVNGDRSTSSNHSSTIHLEQLGNHTVSAVWSWENNVELNEDDFVKEVKSHPEITCCEWELHVVNKSTDIGDIRRLIDDITRVGTVVWGSKKLIERLRQWGETGDDHNEDDVEEGDEYIQETITNY